MAEITESELSAKVRPLWLRAQSAVELKNYSYAISLLQAVLKDEPSFLDARKLLRDVEFAKNAGSKSFLKGLGGGSAKLQAVKAQGLLKKEPLAAIEAAEKVLETDPGHQQANLVIKEAALGLGFMGTAGFCLETLVKVSPNDPKVLHLFARFHFDHGDPNKAVEVYSKLVEMSPTDLEATKLAKDAAAKTTMKHGGWETAESYRDIIHGKDEAVKREQDNRAHKDDATIDDLLQGLWADYEQNPQNLDVVRKTAGLYEQKEDFEKALEWFEYANQLTKGADPGILKKISELKIKNLEVRLASIEAWLATDPPEDEKTAAFRAEVESIKVEKAETMLADARRAVERNPTDLTSRLELGELLVHAGHIAEAIPELQKARQSPNGRYKAILLLAKCYMTRKMFDLASGLLLEASNELPGMDILKKEVVYTLGTVYEKMGNRDKSLECMKQIYAVDAGYLDVADRVESSYE